MEEEADVEHTSDWRVAGGHPVGAVYAKVGVVFAYEMAGDGGGFVWAVVEHADE